MRVGELIMSGMMWKSASSCDWEYFGLCERT